MLGLQFESTTKGFIFSFVLINDLVLLWVHVHIADSTFPVYAKIISMTIDYLIRM